VHVRDEEAGINTGGQAWRAKRTPPLPQGPIGGGPRPRGPEKCRVQRSAPLPQGPLGGPCRRGPRGKAEHGRLYGICNHTRWPGAQASSYRLGGTASPRSGKIAGAEDCAPSWESPDRRHPAAFSSSRGTASPRSAGASGIEDCAPPARSHGRGRVPAVRSNAPIICC
jgi:hypothetical protein